MNVRSLVLLVVSSLSAVAADEFGISSFGHSGAISFSNAFPNGVCVVERADFVEGSWWPVKNIFTTSTVAEASLVVTGNTGFFRAQALNLAGGRPGFTNLTRAYGL